jgi:hypothetical protein
MPVITAEELEGDTVVQPMKYTRHKPGLSTVSALTDA